MGRHIRFKHTLAPLDCSNLAEEGTMRVTRAALRAGIVHEDEETSHTIVPPPAPHTPKAALQDITSKNTVLTLNMVHQTPKFDPEVHQGIRESPEDADS